MHDDEYTRDKMLYINGNTKSFRCDCGCNVFRKFAEHRYRCNSCEQTYNDFENDEDIKQFVKEYK